MSLLERLEGELRGGDCAQVETLNLDHTPSGGNLENSGLTSAFVNLRSLSLNGVSLTVLRHLPELPKLRKLELADNRLSSGLDRLAVACPQLVHLNVANNRFKDISSLEPLKALKHLKTLSVDSNPVANPDSYRTAIFNLLPSLQYIDDEDQQGESRSDDSDDEEDGEDGDEEEEGEDGEQGADDEEVVQEGEEGEGGDEEEDDDEDGEEEPGLEELQREIGDDEDAGEDFEPGEGDEDEDDEDEDEDEDDDNGDEPAQHRNKMARH